ncbi:hypothetical protein OI25_813 [Paraburkholderia fungorum]|uniref:Uncharacterized protein n=1 Tax=Paraburkholderia fungorum TaxID=134537 RepID=A0AAU8T1Y5_9BURK|nr:hypothetical protein OI25_813 [Paraburkholderia fungorum]
MILFGDGWTHLICFTLVDPSDIPLDAIPR